MKDETKEILGSAKEYIGRLIAGLEGISASLRAGSGYQINDFSDMYEGMRWLSTALASTADDHGIQFELEKLGSVLKELLEAIDNDDRVLIADLLEYEILPLLAGFNQKIIIE